MKLEELEQFVKRGAAAQQAVDTVLADVSHGGGAARCVKCGRTFRSPHEYRFNAKGQPICRRFCREAR